MKHLRQLNPGAQKALAAVVILAACYPLLARTALHYASTPTALTVIGTAAALILLARIGPEKTHDKLKRATGPTLATWITGHRPPKPKDEPTFAHAPSSGHPQIPVHNPTR